MGRLSLAVCRLGPAEEVRKEKHICPKTKINKGDLIKLKSFCTANKSITR